MGTATVIGGGPAGAVAAFILARRGWAVTLVEQHRFPRDKVCGECLSALGIEVLARVGLYDVVESAGPVLLTHTWLHSPDGQSVRLPLPRAMWGISRRLMDAVLLQAAGEAGVRMRQPARCEGILPGDKPSVTVRDPASNTIETLWSDVVLLADGKAALLPARPRATGDFGIKAHFTGVSGPRDAIELFGVRGHYGGLAPVESSCPLSPVLRGEGWGEGRVDEVRVPRQWASSPSPRSSPVSTTESEPEQTRWNAAFSVPATLLDAYRGNLDALFAATVLQNPALCRRFASAQRIGPWLASPLPRFAVARAWPAGVIPIGNAAAALEPIGGEGMGLALRSAELVATALADAADAGRKADVRQLRSQCADLWQTRRFACRAAAMLVAQPALSGAALDWIQSNDRLASFALRLIGKAG